MRVSESIIDLGDDRLDAVLIIECVEERHRIEGVSEDARVGQRQDARGAWRPRLDTELTERLGERATGSFLVIPVAQGDEIPAVVAKEAKPLVELRKLVEVDKPQIDGIAKPMVDRTPARVRQRPAIQSGSHAATSMPVRSRSRTCSATSSPERSPSSWNPKLDQAPQNQVWRVPWISGSRFCAFSAGRSNRG